MTHPLSPSDVAIALKEKLKIPMSIVYVGKFEGCIADETICVSVDSCHITIGDKKFLHSEMDDATQYFESLRLT
jgi:hypothetical protein